MSEARERYKIFFYRGNELSLKAHAFKGEAWIDGTGIEIKGADGDSFHIARADIQKVEMYRLHGLGRVVRIEHHGGRLFLSAIRLMIGQFALINFFRTGRLQRALAALLV